MNCDACAKWRRVKPVKRAGDKTLDLLYRKIGTVITNIESGKLSKDGKPTDPWKRFQEWPEYDQQALLDTIGPIPLASIEHVPEPELLHYAVRDADADLRLYLFMRNLHPWIFY